MPVNSLLLPTTQQPTESPENAFIKGLQIRAAMNQNSMQPLRQESMQQQVTGMQNQNALDVIRIEQEKQSALLRKYKPVAQAAIAQWDSLLKKNNGDEAKAAQEIQPFYNNIRDAARKDGIEADDTFNVKKMRDFAGMPDPFKAGAPNMTKEQLIDVSKHDVDPSTRKRAQENLDEMQKRDIALAKEKSLGSSPDPFTSWSKEDKEWWFQNKKDTGEGPKFGFGDKRSYSQFNKEYSSWARGQGVSGKEAAAGAQEFKAEAGTLKDLSKRRGLIDSFVTRIDKTSDVVTDLATKLSNKDSRILNMPINKAKQFMGSGDIASLELALTSLSNEVAKVESGSLGIAGVSVDQAKIMSKIHDKDLSLSDLVKVINTGKTLGKTSMDSIDQSVKNSRGRLGGQGEPLTATNPKTGQKIKSLDGGKTWIQASADNAQLAQVTAEDVPVGSGTVNNAKSIMQIRQDLNKAYRTGDYQKADELEKQLRELAAKQKNVG